MTLVLFDHVSLLLGGSSHWLVWMDLRGSGRSCGGRSCGGLNSGGGQTISGGVGLPVGISGLLVFCGSVPGCVWLCGSVYVKGFGGRGVERRGMPFCG